MGLEMAKSVAIATDDKFMKFAKNVPKKSIRPMNAPKIICHNHMQPHACAGCHPKALLKFSTFDSESASCASKLAASMGPMGLRHVWPFMLAPSGRSWQTHAWGCCQHVWALCHALGCTLPGCFGVLTVFGPHLGISLWTTGILAVFCRLWAAANWAMVGARPCKVAQSLL